MQPQKKHRIAVSSFFIGFLLLLAACRGALPAAGAAEIESLGQALAGWADAHCTTIWIEGAPINLEDGNAGGCSMVWWQHPEGLAYAERGDEIPEAIRPGAKAWHERNLAVRAHLAQLLENSECDLPGLLDAAAQFSLETTSQEVAAQLACLGRVTFEPVEHGVE